MRHASEQALDSLEAVLRQIRKHEGLTERKRGIFYRGSSAFLHFHEDPDGLFADLRVGAQWERFSSQHEKWTTRFSLKGGCHCIQRLRSQEAGPDFRAPEELTSCNMEFRRSSWGSARSDFELRVQGPV